MRVLGAAFHIETAQGATWRREVLERDTLVLHRSGAVEVSPELAPLPWLPSSHLLCTISAQRLTWSLVLRGERGPAPLLIDERPALEFSGVLTLGARLAWGPFRVETGPLPPLPAVVQRLPVRTPADRAVIADELEASGDPDAARWVRLGGASPSRAEWKVAARRVPSRLRALLGEGSVERCQLACDRPWAELPINEARPFERHCAGCFATVRWVEGRAGLTGPVVRCPSAEPLRAPMVIIG